MIMKHNKSIAPNRSISREMFFIFLNKNVCCALLGTQIFREIQGEIRKLLSVVKGALLGAKNHNAHNEIPDQPVHYATSSVATDYSQIGDTLIYI